MSGFEEAAMLAVAVIGAGTGVYSAVSQGEAQDAQAKAQANQEQEAARGREIQRRRQLIQALASQSAAAGAKGAAPSGSIAGMAGADVAYERQDSLFDTSRSNTLQDVLRARGRNARVGGYVNAGGSLMDSLSSGYKTFGGGTASPGSSGSSGSTGSSYGTTGGM